MPWYSQLTRRHEQRYAGHGTMLRRGLHIQHAITLAAVLSGCASSVSNRWRPNDVVVAPRISSIALLGALHPSDSMVVYADSTLADMLSVACPAVSIIRARDVESRFAARSVVIPRHIDTTFIQQAHSVLDADLLLAPTVLGVLLDSRSTFAGLASEINGDFADETGGISLDGWDLRSGRRAVRVIRKHSSSNSWNGRPLSLFRNATRDAIQAVSGLCRSEVSPTATPVAGQVPQARR